MKQNTACESCAYFAYDDECECYICEINLDEDEMAKFITGAFYDCPYYDRYDEYKIVRKQN